MLSYNQIFAAFILLLLLLLIGFLIVKLIFSRRKSSSKFHSDQALQDMNEAQLADKENKLLRTYFRGLSYVLANETDKAVAEFVKVAQVDTTTAEIYLALGQLFRSTGEVERAIRVHRDILLRPNLPDDVRQQTFFEIGLDYKKAGLFDRACRTFEEIVKKNPQDDNARKELSSIYIRMREWGKALTLHDGDPSSSNKNNILAHLTTEFAKATYKSGNKENSLALIKKAIKLDENCVDAWLSYGDFLLNDKSQKDALAAWEKAFLINPEFSDLVIERFAKLPVDDRENTIKSFFTKHLKEYGGRRKFEQAYINWQIELGDLHKAGSHLKELLIKHGGDSKSFSLAKQLIEAKKRETSNTALEQNDLISLVDDIFSAQYRFEKNYRCQKCGYSLEKINWQCPRCSSWDSIFAR